MREAHEAAANLTRRQLVRAAASGSGTTAVGPAFVVAPSDRQSGTETVTAEATVVPASTPSADDYTGRLVHVVGRSPERGSATAGSATADTVGDGDRTHSDHSDHSDEQLQRYEAVFVEPAAADADSRTSFGDLLVLATTPLPIGSLFVVERARRESGRTHVRLEQVSASRVELERSERTHDSTVPATIDRCRAVTAAGIATVSTLANVFAVVYAFGRRVGSR